MRLDLLRSVITVVTLLPVAACGGLNPHPSTPAPVAGTYRPPEVGVMRPVVGQLPVPYESVCRSQVQRKALGLFSSNWVSSGALLEDDMLLTAAHNYATIKSKVHDRSVQCGTGVAAAGVPWWTVEGGFNRKAQVRHPADFSPPFDWPRDYALVHLVRKAPRASSFRLPRPGDPPVVVGDTLFIAGFPGELPNTGSILQHARVVVTQTTDDEIHYGLNSETGLSGAPVWAVRGGEYVLVGVHVGEGPEGNAKAHRLGDTSLRNVAAWRAEFHPGS